MRNLEAKPPNEATTGIARVEGISAALDLLMIARCRSNGEPLQILRRAADYLEHESKLAVMELR